MAASTFPDRLKKVENVYVEIISAIHESEDVNLFVKDRTVKEKVSKLLDRKDINPEKIHFFVFDYADVWFRDYGPIFVLNKAKRKLAMLHWVFNAWGKKYEELLKDARIPSVINRKMRLQCFNPGIVLEGGSLDVNGRGTLLPRNSAC